MSTPRTRPASHHPPASAHRFGLRVYWEDTDAAGIVYYADYLRFIERARSDLVRRAGIDQAALLAEAGIAFQVRRCVVDYLAPARLDDELVVETRLHRLAGARMEMTQTVTRDGDDLVRCEVSLACVGPGARPRRIPGEVRRALALRTTKLES